MNKDDIVLKSVAILISRMEIKLTMPEDAIVKQEDDAGHVSFEEGNNRDELKSENRRDAVDQNNPNMYFIAKGSCEVTVRTNYDI